MRQAWLILIGFSCSGAPPQSPTSGSYHGGEASFSRAADRMMVAVPAGPYIAGSTPEERLEAYDDYFASAGEDAARTGKWFAHEEERHVAKLGAFHIDLQPVTNAAYAEFVRDTDAGPPFVSEAVWRAQGFGHDYDAQVRRYNWDSETPPAGREYHPVVLVTWEEALAYCAWRGALVGEARRLPTAPEFERAVRGPEGQVYPWGSDYRSGLLNSHVDGPDDTVAVGSFPDGVSPSGILDGAGNVRQWTATPWPHERDAMTVKGSAWDAHAGLGRGAAVEGFARSVRHVGLGFRCAADG